MVARALTHQTLTAQPAVSEARTRIYYWWLLLVLVFEYVRPGTFLPAIDAVKLGTLIPGGLFAVTLFAPGLRPWRDIISDRYTKWLLVYIGLIAVSVLFATVTLYAYTTLTAVLTHFTLFFMIVRIATSLARLRGIFATLIAAHVLLVVLNPGLILTPDARSYITGSPFLGDGNDFALSLCILLPLGIEIARHASKKLGQIIGWASVAAILIAIVGTQSRGASLAVAAIALFLFRYSNRKMLSLVVILFVGMLLAAYASDAYFSRLSTISHYEGDGSARGRIMAWKAGARMAIDHPLGGVGAGHFPTSFGRYSNRQEGEPWILTAHSMYFLVLGELGFPGLIALLALTLGSPFMLIALRRRILAFEHPPPLNTQVGAERFLHLLAAACIGFAVAGAFLSVSYYPHLFVLTAMTASTRLIVRAFVPEAGLSGPPAAPNKASARPMRRR